MQPLTEYWLLLLLLRTCQRHECLVEGLVL
jgi:hypothetical protein